MGSGFRNPAWARRMGSSNSALYSFCGGLFKFTPLYKRSLNGWILGGAALAFI
jgi:hypothetical protein